MQEEFQGGVTENVRGKCQRQTAASGCCTSDLFTRYLIKLLYEGIQHPEWSMSQTTGIKVTNVQCRNVKGDNYI